MRTCIITFALTGIMTAGCSDPPPLASGSSETSPAVAVVLETPVSIAVQQRSTTSVPGWDGEASLTIDDITRGQVMVTLSDKAGQSLLGPRSMKKGEAVTFEVRGTRYQLELIELNNSLLGDDTALFVIWEATAEALTEAEKIERLIAAVQLLTDASFIRNGEAYSAGEAAEHLRRKHEATKQSVRTASEFIDSVASKSSISGEDYEIRFPEGRTITAAEFFREELAKLEAGVSDPATEPAATPEP